MRVKNMLIYICGFTRGDCQIILDKAWKYFCIYGTLDLLKGTTKQITTTDFAALCKNMLKCVISAGFPSAASEINIGTADFCSKGETLLASKKEEEENDRLSIF